HLGGNGLVFSVLVCVLAMMLFGLTPAVRGSHVALAPGVVALGTSGAGVRCRLVKVLVVSEVAFSVLLLTGAGLFTRSLLHLRSQNLGVDDGHTLLLWTSQEQVGKGPRPPHT